MIIDLYEEEKGIEMEKRFPGEKNPYLILSSKKKEIKQYAINGILGVVSEVVCKFGGVMFTLCAVGCSIDASNYSFNSTEFLSNGISAMALSGTAVLYFLVGKDVNKAVNEIEIDIKRAEREIGGIENRVIEEEIRMENELVESWKKE